MPGFFSLLEERARQIDSLLCIGLDPHPSDLQADNAEAARDYCLRLIEATSDLALAFKPNAAFFEAFGPDGWGALQDVIRAVPPGIPVVLDAKRGDIASTAEAYARSAFETLGAHAITLNPYLGYDSLQPFLADAERGVFVLCKTSNPGSKDLQDLSLAGGDAGLMLYEKVASLAQQWNTAGNLGLVVGATHPEAVARVRRQAPDLWLLAPGVGAQGGDLAATLAAGLRPDGLGLLLPVSRAVGRSANPRQAALDLLQAIRQYRAASRLAGAATDNMSPLFEDLARGLLDAGCVRFGQFTLKSGIQSPIYIDLRQFVSFPRLLSIAARAYLPLLRRLEFDRLAALPYAALPIATAISLQTDWPMIYPRKEAKRYGTRAEIEGQYKEGERVVVIDDLATTGESKFEAIEKLTSAGLSVRDVVVLVDRQSGAGETLDRAGYHLHAVTTLTQLLDYWERSGWVPAESIIATRKFLNHV